MIDTVGHIPEHVCLIAPPFRTESGWVTVPPAGYGGIQWSMAQVMDGLLDLGVHLSLLGAPGSNWNSADVEVPDVAERSEIISWLRRRRPAVIHDFANFSTLQDEVPPGSAYCRTWQLTSEPPGLGNTVFVSDAQMRSVGVRNAAVIPLPVNANRYHISESKGDYLLFLGRISAWKGAYEAAALADYLGAPLVVAGPSWESDYVERILTDFPHVVTLVGEVGGTERVRLLAEARALTVLSQPIPGPWGQTWCEPGAAVVSEAAASGTPIVATDNGCLPSLMPGVGIVVPTGSRFDELDPTTMSELPTPSEARETAIRRWGHVTIAHEYLDIYKKCVEGRLWR